MTSFFNFIIRMGETASHWLLLAIRLFWGSQFALAGWGKLQNISSVASSFSQLGIPFAEHQAYLVGYVEFIGGLMLVLGLLSRLVSIPLIIVMLVALFTAHAAFLANPITVVNEPPFNFLLACLIIFCFGAGKFSLDYLIKK